MIILNSAYRVIVLNQAHFLLAKVLFCQERKWKRARWDLNPRSPAPKADTLIRARLRALFYAIRLDYLDFSLA